MLSIAKAQFLTIYWIYFPSFVFTEPFHSFHGIVDFHCYMFISIQCVFFMPREFFFSWFANVHTNFPYSSVLADNYIKTARRHFAQELHSKFLRVSIKSIARVAVGS